MNLDIFNRYVTTNITDDVNEATFTFTVSLPRFVETDGSNTSEEIARNEIELFLLSNLQELVGYYD